MTPFKSASVSLTGDLHRCGVLLHCTVHCQYDHIWRYHCCVVLEDTHFEAERLAIVYTCMHKQSTVHFVLILQLMNGGFMTA